MIGIRIQKKEGEVPFENRYYCDLPSLDSAQNLAGAIVNFEKQIHSVRVEFIRANLWVIGESPRRFRPVPLSGFGVIGAANPTALELTINLQFGLLDSYSNAKFYRVAVNSDNTNTRTWSATYLSQVLTAMEDADQAGIWGTLTSKTGAPLDDPVLQTSVAYRQLDKRWYNRKPKTP